MSTIQQKFVSLGGAQEFGAAVGALNKVDVTSTEQDTGPNGKPTKPVKVTEHIGEFQRYQKGVIAIHAEVNKNAFAVHGPIFPLTKWGPGSTLGWPSGDSQQVMKGGKSAGWSSAFDAQSLYLKAGESAAIALTGPIAASTRVSAAPAAGSASRCTASARPPTGRAPSSTSSMALFCRATPARMRCTA